LANSMIFQKVGDFWKPPIISGEKETFI